MLTSEPISAKQVRDALGGDEEPQEAEVMVVAPAFQESGVKFWVSDADEAIARAQQVSSETVQELDEGGVGASGDTGDSDPTQAIQDALQTFPADRIVVFTHAGSDQRYREDLDPTEIEERFGVPVTMTDVSDSAT